MENYNITIQAAGKVALSYELGKLLGKEVLISFRGNIVSFSNAKQLKDLGYSVPKDSVYKLQNDGDKTKFRIPGTNIFREIVQYEPCTLSGVEIKAFKTIKSSLDYVEKGLNIFEFDLTETRKKYSDIVENKKKIELENKRLEEQKSIISSILNTAYEGKGIRKHDNNDKQVDDLFALNEEK